MASLITNMPFMQKLATDLVKSRKMNYSEQCFTYYVEESRFKIENIPEVKNNRNLLLKCTLIRHLPKGWEDEQFDLGDQQPENINRKCIVFLHGLGSSRIQGLPLVRELPRDYCLCIFDLSGSGKSEGQTITYGLRQCQDIEAVVQYLQQKKGIQEFILWGRSMGAVAVLLYAIEISKSQNPKGPDKISVIKSLVIDSPFYDFAEITRHIAVQRLSFPEVFLDVGLHLIDESFEKLLYDAQKQISYNPFQIKFDKEIKCKVPAIFISSETDQVVPISHSHKIMRNYKNQFQKITMESVSHNQQRPAKIIKQIFYLIKKFEEKAKRRQKNAAEMEAAKEYGTSLHHTLFDRKKGIAVYTPSKSKNGNNEASRVSPPKSQAKQNFLDTIEVNLDKKLTRCSSKGLSRALEEYKKRTVDLNCRMKNHPYYSYDGESRKTSSKEPFFDTQNLEFPEIIGEKMSNTSKTAQMGISRGKRYNNFMSKVEPKLSHSRYL